MALPVRGGVLEVNGCPIEAVLVEGGSQWGGLRMGIDLRVRGSE